MPVKISNTYSNPYANAYENLRGTAFFNESLWDTMARQGRLPEYIQTITDAQNKINIEQFNEDYGMPTDPDIQFAALQNSLYSDRNKITKFQDSYTDEYGQEQTKIFEGTEYEYQKQALKSLSEYKALVTQLENEQEAKDNLNGFLQFLSGVTAGFGETFKSVLNMVGNIAGAPQMLFESLAAAADENFDEKFRSDLKSTDINYHNWFRLGDHLLNAPLTEFERKYSHLRDIQGNMTHIGEFYVGICDSVGKMIPTIALSFIPGAGTVSNVLYWVGLGTERVYEMDVKYDRTSVSTLEALAHSVLETGVEWAIGEGLNKVFGGPSIVGKYRYGGTEKPWIPFETENRYVNSFEYFLQSAIHEGVEEVSQDFGTFLLDQLWGTVNKNMLQNNEFTIQTAIDAFWSAFLCSFVVGGVTSEISGKEVSGEAQTYKFGKKKGEIKTDRKGNIKFKKFTALETAALRADVKSILDELTASEDLDTKIKNIDEQRSNLNQVAVDEIYKDVATDVENSLEGRRQALTLDRNARLRAAYDLLNGVSSMYGAMGETRFKNAMDLLQTMWSAYDTGSQVEMPVYDRKGNLVRQEVRTLTYNDIVQHFKYAINIHGSKLSLDEYKTLTNEEPTVVYNEEENVDASEDTKFFSEIRQIVEETSAKKVAIAPSGNQVLTDGETIIIPAGLLEKTSPEEVIKAVQEQKIVRTTIVRAQKDSRFKTAINKLSASVRDFLNNQNLSDVECLEQILYNSIMFRSVLFTTYNDAVDFLVQLRSEVANELKNVDSTEVFTNYFNTIFDQQKQMLIEYLSMQNSGVITEQDLSELVARNVLTNDDKNLIRRRRWSRDLSTKIADGRKLLKKAELGILESRVNNSTFTQNEKTKLMSDIASADRTRRVRALRQLDTRYDYVFNGPFNGVIYPKLVNRSARFFAAWLINNDITLQNIMSPSPDSALGRRMIAEGLAVTSENAFNYVKSQYETARPEHTIVKNRDGLIIEMTRRGKGFDREQYSYEYDKMVRDNEKAFYDSLQTTEEYQNAQTTLRGLMNKDAEENTFGDIRIQDLIYFPSLLNKDTREDILEFYGNLSPAAVAAYIHQTLLNSTNKNVGLTLMQSGEYRLASVKYQRQRLKNPKLQFSDIKNATFVTDYLNLDASNDLIRDCTVMVVKDSKGDIYAQYDPKRNTIFLYTDKNVSSDFMIWALLHEAQHLVQTANGMNIGAVNVFTMIDEKGNRVFRSGVAELFSESVRKQIISDMKKHYEDEFVDCKTELDEAHRAEVILYFSTGESQAFGQYYLGDVLRLQDEDGFMTGFETPWGKRYMTKGNKDSISALTYDGNEKRFENVVKYSRSKYTPFDYHANIKGFIFPNGDILQAKNEFELHRDFYTSIDQNTEEYFEYLAYYADAIQITTDTQKIIGNKQEVFIGEDNRVDKATPIIPDNDITQWMTMKYSPIEIDAWKIISQLRTDDSLNGSTFEISLDRRNPVQKFLLSKTNTKVDTRVISVAVHRDVSGSVTSNYSADFDGNEDFSFKIISGTTNSSDKRLVEHTLQTTFQRISNEFTDRRKAAERFLSKDIRYQQNFQDIGYVFTIRLTNDIMTSRTVDSLLEFMKNAFDAGDEIVLADAHGITLVDSRGTDTSSILKADDSILKDYLNALWKELAEEEGLSSKEVGERAWRHDPQKLLKHYKDLRIRTRFEDPSSIQRSSNFEYQYFGENIQRALDVFEQLKEEGKHLKLPTSTTSFDQDTAKSVCITPIGNTASTSAHFAGILNDRATEFVNQYNSNIAQVFFDTLARIDFGFNVITLPYYITKSQAVVIRQIFDDFIASSKLNNTLEQLDRWYISDGRGHNRRINLLDDDLDNQLMENRTNFDIWIDHLILGELAKEANSSMAKVSEEDMPKAPKHVRVNNVRPNRKPRGRVTRADVEANPILNKFLEKRTLLDDDTKAFVSEADPSLIHPDLWDMIGGDEAGTLTYMKVLRFFKECDLDTLNNHTFNLIRRYYFPNSPITSAKELQHVISLAPEAFALRLTLSNTKEGAILLQEVPLEAISGLAGKMYTAQNKYGAKYRKISDNFPASELDDSTQRMHAMLLYDGSIESLFVVAAYGVNEVTSHFKDRNVTSLDQSVYSNKDGKEITLGEMIGAIDKTEFDDDITTFVVDNFSRKQKLSLVYQFMYRRYLQKLISQNKTETEEESINYKREWMKKHETLSDDDLDKAFIVAMNKLVRTVDTEITQAEIEEQAITIRLRSNIIGNIKRLARTIRNNLSPLAQAEFDKQYPEVAALFDESGRLKKDAYFHQSKEKLYDLEHQLRELAADARHGKFNKGKTVTEEINRLRRRVDKQRKEIERLKTKTQTINGKKVKTYYVPIGSDTAITTSVEMPTALKPIYQRAFKFDEDFQNAAVSETQYVTTQDEAHIKQSAKDFIERQADLLGTLDQSDVDDIINYFSHTVVIGGLKAVAINRYNAVKMLILTYIVKNSQGDMSLYKLTDEQRSTINGIIDATVSESGQIMTIWRDSMADFDPRKVIVSHFAKQYKIEANPEDVDALVDAFKTGDYDKIQEAKKKLYVNCESNYLKRFKKWKVWRVPEDRDVYFKVKGSKLVAIKVDDTLYSFVNPDSVWTQKRVSNNKVLVYDQESNRYIEVVQVEPTNVDRRNRTYESGLSSDGINWADTNTRIPKHFKRDSNVHVERIVGFKREDVLYERSWNQLTEEQRNSISREERIAALRAAGATQVEVNESQLQPDDIATATEVQYRDKWFNTLVNRLWKFERMAMLSGPGTWVRNMASNVLVTTGNITSDYVGNFLTQFLPKKWKQHREGQYKIIGTKVTSDISTFIKTKLVETGWFDLIADSASRYNLEADRQHLSSDNLYALVTQMIVDKISSEITMNNQFDNKTINWLNKQLMTVLSDDNIIPFITNRAIYYLGRMMTEDGFKAGDGAYGYDLNMFQESLIKIVDGTAEHINPVDFRKFQSVNGEMTREKRAEYEQQVEEANLTTYHILDTMAEAYRMAAFEYMHKPNFWTDIEQRVIRPKFGATGFFLYKQIFPFAAASWNWFVEGLNYTPIGLVKGIIQLARLENTINKMERTRQKGTEGISSRFAEFLAKRNLGKGAIGSITMLIGALLCGLGAIRLKDDDKQVIVIGDLEVDITRLFGTQGIMLGITIGNSIREMATNGFDFGQFFSDTAESLLRDSFASDLYSNFKYNDTLGEYLLDIPENMALSFVPNLWKFFVAGMVNSAWNVEYKYSSDRLLNFMERFAAQVVPGAPAFLPVKVDPFTGQVMHKYKVPWLNEFTNRILPFKISSFNVSDIEQIAMRYGVIKNQLTGKYNDIGELSDADKMKLNEFYGALNAKDLQAFFDNKTKYSVQDKKTGKQKELMFRQMTDEQIKSVINRIMSDNASIAKIYIWTQNGKKYYGTATMLAKLKAAGVRTNVYLADKKHDGFIS